MKKELCISGILSIIFTIIVIYIAFDHNPQGEFFDTKSGEINFETAFFLAGLYFIVTFVFFFIFLSTLKLIINKIKLWKHG